MQFVTLACIIIMKGSVMLEIKIKVNDSSWKDLPKEIAEAKTLESFKRELKKH